MDHLSLSQIKMPVRMSVASQTRIGMAYQYAGMGHKNDITKSPVYHRRIQLMLFLCHYFCCDYLSRFVSMTYKNTECFCEK